MKIGILLGDDIGLEVVPESVKVIKAAAAKTGLSIEWLMEETLWDRADIERVLDTLTQQTPQVILAGPPGTSKTWTAELFARYLTQDRPGQFRTVQFHPSYSYEEFVEGLRPETKNGGISFELAALAFEDPRCLVGPDHIDERGELRWHAIGAAHIESEPAAVLLVVHAYREDRHGKEIIRIISARRAEKHEIRRYQEQRMA